MLYAPSAAWQRLVEFIGIKKTQRLCITKNLFSKWGKHHLETTPAWFKSLDSRPYLLRGCHLGTIPVFTGCPASNSCIYPNNSHRPQSKGHISNRSPLFLFQNARLNRDKSKQFQHSLLQPAYFKSISSFLISKCSSQQEWIGTVFTFLDSNSMFQFNFIFSCFKGYISSGMNQNNSSIPWFK